jgi:3',5'-cyclic AMP phosphodiesterase CpdA
VRELVSVAPDAAELFVDGRVMRFGGLSPARDYRLFGVELTTQPSLGEVHCVIATGNDVHFGETVCGKIEGDERFEVFGVDEGTLPYPELMSRAVVDDIASISPDCVVVKGDLTDDGRDDEYDAFLEVWGGAFGERLVHVRGNHDSFRGQGFAAWPWQSRVLAGATIALVDTARPFEIGGALDADQLDWLDALGAGADQPVIVLGHHPVWNPEHDPELARSGIAADDSRALIEVMARRPALSCYLSGHTHRNHRQVISGVVFAEVACVKDFPGGWAEYRVCERGIAAVFHRASSPDAVRWAEHTRGMFAGHYGRIAMGRRSDRSFVLEPRAALVSG